MKRILITISILFFFNIAIANAGWLDWICKKYPNYRLCNPEDNTITLIEIQEVPNLSDETAAYSFNSTSDGDIVFDGSCGEADTSYALSGDNTVTWVLDEGAYDDCAVKVVNSVGESNTLYVAPFEVTNKRPVVFVHGWGGNADGWNAAISYLKSQGWPSSMLYAGSIQTNNGFKYPVCGTYSQDQSEEVDNWITSVLNDLPGFDEVDLVGHSRGGANIMCGLLFGQIDDTRVRHVVTLSGVNLLCSPYYGALPADATPGNALYSVYYSDPGDAAVDFDKTHVDGAYEKNLIYYTHPQMKSETEPLQHLRDSLLGLYGDNN